jgi:protoheme IX farnesyltransferase
MVEVPYDSQMDRTKNRVLVNELVSTPHALAFALTTALAGLGVLTYGVNELVAVLGGANLFLYTSVYTPLKRQSILNTWVGSVVGAIPPLMGWAAATGDLNLASLVLGGILYSWQFAHFNSLSWNLKKDYGRAGYRMMCVSHPDLCRRTALRYSLLLIPLCSLGAPWLEVTTWAFAIDSIPVNGILVYLAYKFYKEADSSSSRRLFRYSLIHLPALIILMLISKKSLSDGDKEKR